MKQKEFSKYERARIIGARALQISMDAPILLKITKEELEELSYDPLKIAEKELDSGILPISVNRPTPKKRLERIEEIKIEESDLSDEEKLKLEEQEEKEILEGGEILEITNTDEEEFIEEEQDSDAIEIE